MFVPNSEVRYTPTMPRRKEQEVDKEHLVALEKYIYIYETYIMYHNIKCSNVASVYPFTDEAQTSLYKDPVRTAL